MEALQNINLGKIQGKILNLKIGDKVNLELTDEVQGLINAGILTVTENPGTAINEDKEKFENIKGIGPEMADMLIQKYGSYKEFEEKATAKDLESLPGISERGGEEIMKLINKKQS